MNFHTNTRIGFANKNFLVIVPGIETEIRIFQAISFGIGMSLRKGFVSANGNVKLTFKVMEKIDLINMINPNGEIRSANEYTERVRYYLKNVRIMVLANVIVWSAIFYWFLF